MSKEQEYISLKDIFLKIGEYFKYLKGKFIWMVLTGLILGAFLAYKNNSQPLLFKENLTFMMDETKSGDAAIPGLDALGSLFGQKGKTNNLAKILELFESRKIIHNTVFDSVIINGKRDVIANHYLDLYTIEGLASNYKAFGGLLNKQGWVTIVDNNPDFRFTHGNVDDFTPKENVFLRMIYDLINGNESLGIEPQLNSNLHEETGIMQLSMMSEYEDLTISILNTIYKKLSGYFIEKSVEKETKTYNLMTIKRDSIFKELKSAEYALADFKDRNRNLVTVKGYLQQIQLERQASILSSMYRTVVGQMDATEFALKNKTPIVQVVDLPRRPISPSKPSWIMGLIQGGLLGGVLAAFFFIMRKLYKEIMS